jgi:hypothetical protein
MNKIAIRMCLFLSIFGVFSSGFTAFVMNAVGESSAAPGFVGLFVSIGVILAVFSGYLVSLLRRSNEQAGSGKQLAWLIASIIILIPYCGVFGLMSLGMLYAMFFN